MSSSTPDVTVIIGAYQAMPYLIRCLESVEAQTLPAGRMEIVAIDDGSTDGTGEYLEEFAARTAIDMRVVRQENSGGPSGPRNRGIGLARGRYVFFLDADDYFGEEALERMVAMGDRAGTDVVLGKVVGVNRGAAKSMWKQTVERADLYSSNIKFTLSAQKLFRRDLLVRLGMTFDESLKTGEDALFTMEAYLRGNGVSVVADYTCYYLVGRDDGKHVTKSGSYVLRFDSAGAEAGHPDGPPVRHHPPPAVRAGAAAAVRRGAEEEDGAGSADPAVLLVTRPGPPAQGQRAAPADLHRGGQARPAPGRAAVHEGREEAPDGPQGAPGPAAPGLPPLRRGSAAPVGLRTDRPRMDRPQADRRAGAPDRCCLPAAAGGQGTQDGTIGRPAHAAPRPQGLRRARRRE